MAFSPCDVGLSWEGDGFVMGCRDRGMYKGKKDHGCKGFWRLRGERFGELTLLVPEFVWVFAPLIGGFEGPGEKIGVDEVPGEKLSVDEAPGELITKDELRKAYEECRDIPLEQRAKIEKFLKIESELDHQMQNALLPVKSLLQFRTISKQWKFSIDNFNFILSTLSSRTWYNLDYDSLLCESIRIKRPGQAVIDGKIFWIDSERFYSDDGISYKIYMIVPFDLVTHQFHVQDMPEQIGVREFLPPYYISQLGDSLIISGSFDFGDCHIIYAWAVEVEGSFVSSCRLLFTIPHPPGHYLKLLGFSKDKEPIVEATIVQQWYRSLQVFHPTIQYFQNIDVEANRDSFFIGPYKESQILHTERSNEIIY
ncbi:hypothetical protein Tco_1104119 [Tanacetum coccineum]